MRTASAATGGPSAGAGAVQETSPAQRRAPAKAAPAASVVPRRLKVALSGASLDTSRARDGSKGGDTGETARGYRGTERGRAARRAPMQRAPPRAVTVTAAPGGTPPPLARRPAPPSRSWSSSSSSGSWWSSSPSFSRRCWRRRRASQSVSCLAKLKRIAEGGVTHAAAHDGYYPVAGHLQLPDAYPATLDDAEEERYVYYRPPGWGVHAASFQAAIADTLGLKGGLEAYTFETQMAAEDLGGRVPAAVLLPFPHRRREGGEVRVRPVRRGRQRRAARPAAELRRQRRLPRLEQRAGPPAGLPPQRRAGGRSVPRRRRTAHPAARGRLGVPPRNR